jgi:hypothetical protein
MILHHPWAVTLFMFVLMCLDKRLLPVNMKYTSQANLFALAVMALGLSVREHKRR